MWTDFLRRIVSYVRRSRLPVLSTLESTDVSGFKIIDEHVFIACLNPEDADIKSIYEELAGRNHHRFTFGIVTDTSLATAENIHSLSFLGYHSVGAGQEALTGEWRLRSLEAFVERTTLPLIGELTRRNEMKYLQAGKSLLYILAEKAEERLQFQALFNSLAKKYEEYINFVTVDAVDYTHMPAGLGLGEKMYPALALLNPMCGQVFPLRSGARIDLEGVEGWILDIVGGEVEPWKGLQESDDGDHRDTKDEL